MESRIEKLKVQFLALPNWEDRYTLLIKMGKELSPLSDERRLDHYLVKGCQSQVWLAPEFREGRIFFYADSDAAVVKGVIAILLQVYSDATPDEVLATKATFLDEIGLKEHLSMNRANGLASMLKQIYLYATAFKHQQSRGAL